jgi:hypothetical protein
MAALDGLLLSSSCLLKLDFVEREEKEKELKMLQQQSGANFNLSGFGVEEIIDS